MQLKAREVNLVVRSGLLLSHLFSSSCFLSAPSQSSSPLRALPDPSLSPQLPHGHMPLPSFWKVVEDTLQQSGAQLRAFCQAFETVTPSPGTQVGGTGHVSGQLDQERDGIVASQYTESPAKGFWLRTWPRGCRSVSPKPLRAAGWG